MSTNHKWFFVVLMGLAIAASDRAGAYVRRVVELRGGQSTTIAVSPYEEVVVQCGRGQVAGPGQPSYPPYYPPSQPLCQTYSFDQALQQLAMRRDRMAFGGCGYDRNDGYSECEGRLRWRDAMNQKQKFAQDLRSLQMQAESICRDRNCSQLDISRIVRDFDAFVSQLSTQRIVFDGINSTPFIDYPGQYRVNCSGW